MHPHRKECIPHYYYILTSYDNSTFNTTITMDDQEDEDAKMLYMASMFVLAESNFVASVIAKKRKVAPDHHKKNSVTIRTGHTCSTFYCREFVSGI